MSARKPGPKPMKPFVETYGDEVHVEGRIFADDPQLVRVACMRGLEYRPMLLTPAQARRVARALLRFADGAR